MFIFLLSMLAYAVLMFSLTLNPVEVALWLMLIFALLALFSFFLKLEFLGILLIVLYVSALIVLFIYIILLLPPTKYYRNQFWDYVGIFFLLFVLLVFAATDMHLELPWLLNKYLYWNSFYILHTIVSNQLTVLGLTIFFSHSFTYLLLGVIFFFSLLWVLLILQRRV